MESVKSVNIWLRYEQVFGAQFLAHPVRHVYRHRKCI